MLEQISANVPTIGEVLLTENKEQMYRIGKKQKRAILTADGNEVVVFPKGKEALAEKVCNLLNADLEVNKISSNGMLAVTSDSNKIIKKKSVVTVCVCQSDDFKKYCKDRQCLDCGRML